MLWKDIADDVFDIVEGVVREVSIENLTNEQKREAALARVKILLKKEGKEIGDSVLNLILELVVQRVKRG
jgi:hypothetical protein